MSLLTPLVTCWLAGAALLPFNGKAAWTQVVAVIVLVAAAILNTGALWWLLSSGENVWTTVTGHWPQGIGIRLRIDGISLFFAIVCTAILAAVLIHESSAGVQSRLFPALILLLAAGLQGAFFTGDLFNFYVFFELSVVASFALAAHGFRRNEIRATFVYVVLNLLGSVLFLIGVAAAYHVTGTLDLAQMAGAPQPARGLLVLPASLLFAALILKLGLFPFHGWIPVLYENARPAIVAALAGALANLGAYGLIRFGYSTLAHIRRDAAELLLVMGAAAMIYGALLAAYRRRPAGIAAYSAIMHAGQVVLAIGIGGRPGAAAVLFVVLAGSIDKSIMFLSLDAPDRARRVGAFVAAASTAGFPPTLGFLSKVFLFYAAISTTAGRWVIGAVVLAAVIELLAAFRFWRLQRLPNQRRYQSTAFAVGGLAATTVLIGCVPGPAVAIAWEISRQLIGSPP